MPSRALFSFCQNDVVLSAGGRLAWVATLLRADIASRMTEFEAAGLSARRDAGVHARISRRAHTA